jgi:hypothetical protein
MRKTHLEKFLQSPAGKPVEDILKLIAPYDPHEKDSPGIGQIVDEGLFDRVFRPEFLAQVMGGDVAFHTQRIQRKLETSIVQQIYHTWKDRNIFDLTLPLCQKLNATDFRDVDTFFLRAPFRSMYISMPKGNGHYVKDAITGLHELIGIYLLYQDYGDGRDTGIRDDKNVVKDVIKYIHVLACGEEKSLYNDSLVFFHLLFWKGKVSASIERNRPILQAGDEAWKYVQDLFQLVSKILLYINCSNAVIEQIAGIDVDKKLAALKNKSKKRKLLKKFDRESVLPHKKLVITIDRTNKTHSQGEKTASIKKSLERVRGHFKVQRYGTDRSESKIIWIEPYIRGEGSEDYKDERRYRLR